MVHFFYSQFKNLVVSKLLSLVSLIIFSCSFSFLLIGNSIYAKTVVIPIEGEIAPATYTYLERAVHEATNQATQIIFKINTFGGRVDTTYQIVELILSLKVKTISVVEKKAISAGTLIALASEKLYMFEDSTIGDVAPIISGQNGPQMLGEKFQSPLRAKFRSLAQKNGYPIKLSEAFVTDHIEIIKITWKNQKEEIITGTEYADLLEPERAKIIKKETIVKKGELLTMSDLEAEKFGFSSATIKQLSDIAEITEEVIYFEVSQSEKLLAFLNKYAFILILVGLGGIYLEVKNPGFGFYGITSICAFSIFFLSHYVIELATYIELVLMIGSLILIALEIFVFPGFGILGGLGTIGLIASLILMMQGFTIPIENYQWVLFSRNLYTVFFSFLASTLLFLLSLIFFPKIFKKSPVIFSEKNKATNPKAEENDALIGLTGIVYTDLKPSGQIIVANNLYDAISDGEYIKGKESVKITHTRFGIYYVRKINSSKSKL